MLEVYVNLVKGHSFGPWVLCYVDGNFLMFRIIRTSNRINDRYALIVVGQGSQGYSVFYDKDIDHIYQLKA